MGASTLAMILDRRASKGDVFEVARLAGIMAAKRTGDLIPLCHPLGIDGVVVGSSARGILALIGLIVWFAPDLAGSGNNLTQDALLGHGTLLAVTGIFVVRFALGVISYAAATPGGLFAPMLVLGADAGLIVGLLAAQLAPHDAPNLAATALIGMAAFFSATVQAPVTGLVLATEMTDKSNQLPPMLGACAIAMLVAIVLRSKPIYDQLAERAASHAK